MSIAPVHRLEFGGTPNPESPAGKVAGVIPTVSNRVLGSVQPSKSPVVILDNKRIFWLAVLTPLPYHAVPGSLPEFPKTSVVVDPYLTTKASSPLKLNQNETNLTNKPCSIK